MGDFHRERCKTVTVTMLVLPHFLIAEFINDCYISMLLE